MWKIDFDLTTQNSSDFYFVRTPKPSHHTENINVFVLIHQVRIQTT